MQKFIEDALFPFVKNKSRPMVDYKKRGND